jgi:small subunit ribosomal protein S8
MMTDPIADLLTRVRNGVHAKQPKVDVPASQLKVAVVDLWKKGGYIRDYKLYRQDQRGILRIYLKYVDKGVSVIQGIRRVSKPSRRVYASYDQIPKVLNGLGMAVISTSKGVLNDDVARETKVGGEILCSIW